MPRIRLLAPVPDIGAAGDVVQVDQRTASSLVTDQLAVVVRREQRETAVRRPSETTEQR